MTAPFPWFGGKSRAAHLVWPRLGNVPNYVEPFAGSLAMLLARPAVGDRPALETVNDKDALLCNFWRAVTAEPAAVAKAASWPIHEVDLTARHGALVRHLPGLRELLTADPTYCDPTLAGWWVWGLCHWIGGRFCTGPASPRLPSLSGYGKGLYTLENRDRIPQLLEELQQRLRYVRVACGDWERVLSAAVTTNGCGGNTLTGVFLDPPYPEGNMAYATGAFDPRPVRDWAIAQGANPLLRIALCGYADTWKMPADWECVTWKAKGGYGNLGDGDGRENSYRERIWFSPHCLRPTPGLFDGLDNADDTPTSR
jgi:DNA adenine methylase